MSRVLCYDLTSESSLVDRNYLRLGWQMTVSVHGTSLAGASAILEVRLPSLSESILLAVHDTLANWRGVQKTRDMLLRCKTDELYYGPLLYRILTGHIVKLRSQQQNQFRIRSFLYQARTLNVQRL